MGRGMREHIQINPVRQLWVMDGVYVKAMHINIMTEIHPNKLVSSTQIMHKARFVG